MQCSCSGRNCNRQEKIHAVVYTWIFLHINGRFAFESSFILQVDDLFLAIRICNCRMNGLKKTREPASKLIFKTVLDKLIFSKRNLQENMRKMAPKTFKELLPRRHFSSRPDNLMKCQFFPFLFFGMAKKNFWEQKRIPAMQNMYRERERLCDTISGFLKRESEESDEAESLKKQAQ